MILPLHRLLTGASRSLPYRLQYSPCRAVHRDRDTYFETRRRLGWWRRQDFDDKMTYVVYSLDRTGLRIGHGVCDDNNVLGIYYSRDISWPWTGT